MRYAVALMLACILPLHALAGEVNPYAGVFSVLEAESEKHYGMIKFLCLATFSIQHSDGSYTSYHIDTQTIGEGKVTFHPYEVGICDFESAKNMERCKVQKSNWGEHEYLINHQGEADGAFVQAVVDLRNPGAITVSNMRKCPFDEAQIKPFLSDEWQNLSDDDFSWVTYRHFPFNPDQAGQVSKILGLTK